MAIILDNLAIAEAILNHPDAKPNLPNKVDLLALPAPRSTTQTASS